MNSLGLKIVCGVLSIVFFTAAAHAQFTSTLGTSNLTGQRFECVTYPGGQDIVIHERNGKSRKMSRSAALRNVNGSLRRAKARIVGIKGSIKSKNARIKKLLNSTSIVLPKVAEELDRLKLDIPRLEALLLAANGDRSELQFLLSAVKGCGKAPPPLNGSNIIVQYSVQLPKSNSQAYGIHAVHAFAVPAGVPDRICVSVNDGPYVLTGIRYSVGTTFYDGSGTSNPVSHAEPAPLGVGYLPFFGQASLFRLGSYDEDLLEVQEALGKYTFRLFIPWEERNCGS